jgi:hypothetical protein
VGFELFDAASTWRKHAPKLADIAGAALVAGGRVIHLSALPVADRMA